MATFSRLEDIQVWQKARKLTKKIYESTSTGEFGKDYGLRNQISGPASRSWRTLLTDLVADPTKSLLIS